jgi:hypothetical protein
MLQLVGISTESSTMHGSMNIRVTIMSLNLLDVSFVDLQMIHLRFITDQVCISQYTANTNTVLF